MQNNENNKSESNLKKTLATFLVVGVLVISAITINSVQSNAQLEAQTGFFSRILSSVFNNDNILQPEELISRTQTLEYDGFSESFTGDTGSVFRLDGENMDVVYPDSDGVFVIDDSILTGSHVEDAFVVIFEEDSVSGKTKDLLNRRGVDLEVGAQSKDQVRAEILKINRKINRHIGRVDKQQQNLIQLLEKDFNVRDVTRSSDNSIGGTSINNNLSQDEIIINRLQVSLNAVSIENIDSETLYTYLQDVPNVKAVKPVKKKSLLLEGAVSMVDIENIYNLIAPNGHTLTGEGVTIAVLDTGVDYMHPDLGACSFLEQSGCKVVGGYDFINNDPDPMDDHGHGTHVAATAAGKGIYVDSDGNSQQINGIAPDAKILAYKVLGAGGSGSTTGIIAAIEACVDPNSDGLIDDRVDVCTLSLGSPNGDPFDADALAADAAMEAGVIMTIAAGNDGPSSHTIASPGSSLKSITVGAACKPEQIGNICSGPIANFSSRGPLEYVQDGEIISVTKPDIVAPGVNICAAQWEDYVNSASCLGTGDHIAISGTSMATPVVAGVMAILSQAYPNLTTADLKQALKDGALNLNVSEYSQGAGLIQADSTMTLLGYPNSDIAIIEGAPWFISNDVSSNTSTYTRDIIFQNISDSILNINLEHQTQNVGVDISYVPSANIQNINPGENFEIQIQMIIDNTVARSGNFSEIIRLLYNDSYFDFGFSWYTFPYLVSERTVDAPGFFHPNDSVYSQTMSVPISNRMSNQSLDYNVELDLSNVPLQFHDNFSLINYENTINLNPLEGRDFEFTIVVNSTPDNVLPNNRYYPRLKFSSSQENVNIAIKVTKGYVFELLHENQVPDYILFANQNVQAVLEPQVGTKSSFVSSSPGPFNIASIYINNQDDDKRVYSVVIEDGIELGSNSTISQFDVSQNLTQYSISNQPMRGSACFWQFNDSGLNVKFLGSLTTPSNRYPVVRYNPLPEGMRFSQSCVSNKNLNGNSPLASSQIYLTEDVNNDFVLSENNVRVEPIYLYGFNQQNKENPLRFHVGACNSANYRINGPVNATPFWCHSSRLNQDIEAGDFVLVRNYSLYDTTPETSNVPDYLGINYFATDAVTGKLISRSPFLFVTEDSIYAWRPGRTGFLTTTSSVENFYEDYKFPLPSQDLIALGVGPLINTSTIINFKQYFGYIGSYFGNFQTPFIFADGSSELHLIAQGDTIHGMGVELNRNNSYFTERNVNFSFSNVLTNSLGTRFPFTTKSFNPLDNFTYPATGIYEVVLSRFGSMLNIGGNLFETVLNFAISYNTNEDTMPPYLITVQLFSEDNLQNYYNPNYDNTLRVYLSPGHGVVNRSEDSVNEFDVYNLEFANDEIIDVSLDLTLKNNTNYFQQLDLVWNQQAGYYEVDLNNIPVVAGDVLKFNLQATDLVGNMLDTHFIIDYDNSIFINPTNLASECIPSSPLWSFDPEMIELVAGGEVVPLAISLQNLDTVLCQSRNFSAMLRTGIETPGSDKIRFSYTPNVGNTANGGISFSNLDPDEIDTKVIYLRADDGLDEGIYNILIDTENIQPSMDDIYISVNVLSNLVEQEIPAYCAADFNGDGLVNVSDQSLFNAQFGLTNPQFDLTGDGVVSSQDLLLFLGYFGSTGCPPSQTIELDTTESLEAVETGPEVSVDYIVTENTNVKEYEIVIASTSNQVQSNILIPNILPLDELENAQFNAATIPGVQINLENGSLVVPQINPGQTISVFVVVLQ